MMMFAGAALTALEVLTELTNVKAPAQSPAENAAAFGLAEPSSNETMASGAIAPAAPPALSAETTHALLALLGEQGAKHDLARDRIVMPDRERSDEAGSAAANNTGEYGVRSFERQAQMFASDPGRSFVVTA